jgi:outer membrane protein
MKKMILCAICAICGLTASAQAKFGHINSQEVMQAMPEATTMRTEMEALQKQYEADEKAMIAEYQKKVEDYQAQESTMPDNMKQRKIQEIQDMEQKIQQARQDNQQALQKAYADKLTPIQNKVMDAIKAVGNAGGYVYIMETNSIPFINTTLSTDVTAQVKAKLGLK